MFSFYDNVFGDVCSNYSCPTGNGIDNGDTPVILYENKVTNTIQPSSGTCGSSSIARDNAPLKTETIYTDKDDGNQYNPCKYECYKKNKIMVLIDHSNSMGRNNKMEKLDEMLDEIAKAAGANDQMKICYFDGCLTRWFSPKNSSLLRQAKNKLSVGKDNTDFVGAFNTAKAEFRDIENFIPVVFF